MVARGVEVCSVHGSVSLIFSVLRAGLDARRLLRNSAMVRNVQERGGYRWERHQVAIRLKGCVS